MFLQARVPVSWAAVAHARQFAPVASCLWSARRARLASHRGAVLRAPHGMESMGRCVLRACPDSTTTTRILTLRVPNVRLGKHPAQTAAPAAWCVRLEPLHSTKVPTNARCSAPAITPPRLGTYGRSITARSRTRMAMATTPPARFASGH